MRQHPYRRCLATYIGGLFALVNVAAVVANLAAGRPAWAVLSSAMVLVVVSSTISIRRSHEIRGARW
jgi:hypothetical protein